MIFLSVSLCSGPEEGHRDPLSQEQNSHPPSPGQSVSPEAILGLLAWPGKRPGQWNSLKKAPRPSAWSPCLGPPPLQVQIGGAGTQGAMSPGSHPSAPLCPEHHRSPLWRANMFSFIELQCPGVGWRPAPTRRGLHSRAQPLAGQLSSGSKPGAELGSQ